MEKLPGSFYARSAETVARDLLGRHLVCRTPEGGLVRMKLTEIAAYEGATETTSEGAKYAPGLVSISTKFGQRLLDIATGIHKKPSCITLRGAELELEDRIEQVSGPGQLTRRLGMNEETKDLYESNCIYGSIIWIEGEPVDESKIQKKKGNSDNCRGFFRIK